MVTRPEQAPVIGDEAAARPEPSRKRLGRWWRRRRETVASDDFSGGHRS
jgi:hypothetical protein